MAVTGPVPTNADMPPRRRRTLRELLDRVERNPVRKDLSTGRLVEIVEADGGGALVRLLFEPNGATWWVPADQLTTRIGLWG